MDILGKMQPICADKIIRDSKREENLKEVRKIVVAQKNNKLK